MPKLPWSSIETKRGVNEPGYEPPVDEPVEIADERGKPVNGWEVLGSLLFPILALPFAIMRFSHSEYGPGIACLLLGFLGATLWWVALAVLAAGSGSAG